MGNYYTFEGSRFSNGGKDGRQQGYAGDIRNPTEAVGTFRVVRDGAPGPPNDSCSSSPTLGGTGTSARSSGVNPGGSNIAASPLLDVMATAARCP